MLDLQNLPPRLSGREASEYLLARWGIKHSLQTLARKRCEGTGPKFRKGDGPPTYDVPDLDAYATKYLGQLVSSTAEYAA